MISGGGGRESRRCLGRLLSPPGSLEEPLWGLFVLSAEGALDFFRFPRENWYTRLIGADPPLPAGGTRLFRLAPEERARLRLMPPAGIFRRLRPGAPPLFRLDFPEPSRGPLVFELEDADFPLLPEGPAPSASSRRKA